MFNLFNSSNASQPTIASHRPMMEMLERRELCAANPLIGTYTGTLTRLSSTKFPTKVTVAAQKGKTTLLFTAVFTVSGFGATDMSASITANSKGSFQLSVGSPFSNAVIAGHLSGSKLVLSMTSYNGLPVSGSLKRK